MNYSENQLIELAKTNPKELARILISPNASINTLTFGAEILGGEISDEEIALPVFKRLIKHINATVREGAVIGISSFYINKNPPQDILNALKIMSTNDPSTTLREYTKSIIKDFIENERVQD